MQKKTVRREGVLIATEHFNFAGNDFDVKQGSHSDWKTWEKWEGIFQSGKSQGILNRLEKSGKITQNTGKYWNLR